MEKLWRTCGKVVEKDIKKLLKIIKKMLNIVKKVLNIVKKDAERNYFEFYLQKKG